MMDGGLVGLDGRMSGPETYARNMLAMVDGGIGYGRWSEGGMEEQGQARQRDARLLAEGARRD